MLGKLLLLVVMTIAYAGFSRAVDSADSEDKRKQAALLVSEGHVKEAAQIYRDLALDPHGDPKYVAADLRDGLTLFWNAGLPKETGALLERAVETHRGNWRVLQAAAEARMQYSSSITGSPTEEAEGGNKSSHERDRTIALQWLLKADSIRKASAESVEATEAIAFYEDFARALMNGRGERYAWRLTALTDLEKIPEFEPAYLYWSRSTRGAPADENGNPVYYHMPESWDSAKNDGERWRWVLGQMADAGGSVGAMRADGILARFLMHQFGVQTMTQDSPLARDAEVARETGPFAVRTLSENETIARVGGALKRFAMPDEFNHIKLFRRIAETKAGAGADASIVALRQGAMFMLAQVFENRQQYHKAVSFLEQIKETMPFPPAEAALQRIVGKNGLLEAETVEPAGKKTTLAYLFRNGRRVEMTAKRLNEEKLLADIRAAMKADDDVFYREYAMRAPEMLGRMVVEKDAEQYVAGTVAQWSVELQPLPDYYSSRARIELPFDQAGCYLVEAAMEDGNTSRIVLWIADLALIRNDLGERSLFFVADARSGEPVPDATVTFAGFTSRYRRAAERTAVEHDGTGGESLKPNNASPAPQEKFSDEFAEKTDARGLVFAPYSRMRDREWIVVAQTDDKRMAYLGLSMFWPIGEQFDSPSDRTAFIITDRPAYRPGQEINFKLWIGKPSYGAQASSPNLPETAITVSIINPRGEPVYEKILRTDEYGGAADSISLDGDAPLGYYVISVPNYGAVGFRLEEYKKPEFEVILDTPDKALTLGDSVQLKVRATYYYGAPVSEARATYKILRTPFANSWVPSWRWDWLYGAGAWLSDYDYGWLPGWAPWRGAIGGRGHMPFTYQQPEVVAEGEGVLDADGVFRIALDTAPAKALFGDQDHAYQVTVEVTDKSRRTIVGSGKVVASRKPFAVAAWTERGYYAAGQDIRVNFRAGLPLGGGLKTTGKATLYKIAYDDDGTPSETEADAWDVETAGESGIGSLRINAAKPGQYRVSCRLRDEEGNEAEGAVLVTVRGEAGTGDFRFTALELVSDRREYQPGDTVRLAVNSANKNAVVLLFLRAERNGVPESGSSDPAVPEVVRLDNGSAVIEIPVAAADQPNFFCDAVTVFDGSVHFETREIFVPPADKTLTVEVESNKDAYAPGAKAEFTVKVADADGKPVVGQCVVSLYDKSVEYVSGGSNLDDIRSRFWSWKRHSATNISSSLDKRPYPVEKRGDGRWEPLGVYGTQEADWSDPFVYTNGRILRSSGLRARSQSDHVFNYASPEGGAMNESSQGTADAYAQMSVAAPMAPMPDMKAMPAESDSAELAAAVGGMVETQVRSEFADTALWVAALETDANGRASFSVDMPENLTGWKARTWVMGHGVRVGEGVREVRTKKNIVVRPQAPRFLTQKDQVILSANLHNYLPRAKDARAELVLEGGLLEAAEGVPLSREVTIAGGGESRVDWLVAARRPGEARVVMKLLTDEESDAAEMIIPVIVHGARTVENFGGVLRDGEDEAVIRLRVPEERLPDQSRLELTFSPTIASSMLEALPYLIEYPYGCTEQTLNRFLPAVTARAFLDGMGATLADAKSRIEGEASDKQSGEWKKTWGDPRGAAAKSPVFDDKELAAMVKAGVERLAAMQNADGGWGWFSGPGERSWPHTTAVVVNGLLAAKRQGAAIPMNMAEDGVNWLRSYQDLQISRLKAGEEDKNRKESADNIDAFIYMILAEEGRFHPDMRDFLYRDRQGLSLSGLSMFGLALHAEKATNALDVVVRNLEQFLDRDPEIGVAWLRTPAGGWWWWYNDSVETQAWYLKLLSRIEPKGEAASGVAKYLLRNRENGAYWRSTRDTAYAVDALAEYAVASGETKPDMTVTVFLDGRQVMERRITPADILSDNRFVLEGLAVESGERELRLVRTGGGNLYYGGALDIFSLEDPIAKKGFELTVDRSYYKLVRENASATMQSASGWAVSGAVERYRRERIASPFDEGAEKTRLESGDLVEVELRIEAKNDYEYLVFEDMKAAGCEAVELRSGYTGNRLGAYVEYRDQKVVLFVRHLPKGVHTIAYRFRAEVPGRFSALPVFGGGMYATNLSANSVEMKVMIVEEGVYDE